MLTTRSLVIAAATLFVVACNASAQTSAAATIPPPQAPFVAEVPAEAQWTLTLKYGKESSGKEGTAPTGDSSATPPSPYRLQQLRVTKLGNQKRDVSVYFNGTTSEVWYTDRVLLTTDLDGKSVYVTSSNADDSHYGERGNPLQSNGFTGVRWIKAAYYDGPARYQNEMCYHYVLKAAAAKPAPDSGNPEEVIPAAGAEAWISVKTNLPVAYRFDSVTYVYSFDAAPPTSMKMPPHVQAKYNEYLQLIGR